MKIVRMYIPLFLILINQTSWVYSTSNLGEFTPIVGSPFATGSNPFSASFSPVISGNVFVAAANANDSTVSMYSVNQTTGSLTAVAGSPFATGSYPQSVSFSPDVSGSLFAAVANNGNNKVSVYSINTTTGAFTPVAGSPFSTGNFPSSVAFSPIASGNLFAAVANASGTVSVYSANTTTGVFTPVAGSPFAAGLGPISVAFSPLVSGNLFAAVTNGSSNTISVYSVNQTTGVFTPVAGSPFATGTTPFSIAFSPLSSGNLFAAVTNNSDNNVSVYEVNQTTGLFTPVTGSPFATGNTPYFVGFSPLSSGNLFAAVTNNHGDNVSVYTINQTTGAFTPATGSPFATASYPAAVGFSPLLSGGLFALVSSQTDNNVAIYNVTSSEVVKNGSALSLAIIAKYCSNAF
ncbi:MAG: beta-propeller fold lactonase family protein [Candidatus Dependentiae bacterium]|nr:beta-propeller fold lactonase family protein [Candidatus Dependentiae bacterium]